MLKRASKRKQKKYTLEELKEKMLLLKRVEKVCSVIFLCLIFAEVVVIGMLVKQETSDIYLIEVVERIIIYIVIIFILMVLAFIALCKVQNHCDQLRDEIKSQIRQEVKENMGNHDFVALKNVANYLKEFNIK